MSAAAGTPETFDSPGTEDTLNQRTLQGSAPESQIINRNLLDALDQVDPPTPPTTLPDSPALNQTDNMATTGTPQVSPGTTAETSYEVNGMTLKVQPNKVKKLTTALLTKERRRKLSDKERLEHLALIQKNQQVVRFKAITISRKDPEKLTNTHSIAKLLEEHRRNLEKYDLLAPYTIVEPHTNSFDSASTDFTRLMIGKDNKPITYDLHKDYLRLTAKQVARSTQWYVSFTHDDDLIQEDLLWSYSYYEKNVDETLYATVHSKWMSYSPEERGGPLFLKLLLDQVTTTSESNLKALIEIVETYQIKTSCPGEDIDVVVPMFRSIFNNIESLRKGNDLPLESTRNLLRVFQSTSVDSFNSIFEDMEKQLINTEIQTAVNPDYVLYLTSIGGSVLTNDSSSIQRVLQTAEVAYRNLLQKGEWDKVMQKPPGQAAFNIQGVTPPPEEDNQAPPVIFPPGTCFNCGGAHHLRNCPHPRNKARIDANRAAHPNGIGPRKRPVPHKWRPPEEQEHNKRIIDGKPHTWDPHGGYSKSGRWIPDDTPNSGVVEQPTTHTPGQPIRALTQVPTQVDASDASLSNTSIGSLTHAMSEATDLSLRKYHAHLLIKQLTDVMEK